MVGIVININFQSVKNNTCLLLVLEYFCNSAYWDIVIFDAFLQHISISMLPEHASYIFF